jgi:probable H4MPT-linked C1 transfer pathway protein
MMTKKGCLGWDIGGAHLKAVLLDEIGAVLHALQLPCPLWKGLNYLEAALVEALKSFKIEPSGTRHVVTMTGELVDLFSNRREGVVEISNSVTKLLGRDTLFYAVQDNGKHGFVTLEDVFANAARIASANWHASASALGNLVSEALFVDVGSTTTDIIAIEAGKVKSTALSDADRMADDSLVYTGVVRTPVMALAQKLPFEGAETNVAAEYFATMADVYRLTNELSSEYDVAETADGKSKSTLESARRLARMIGHDAEDKPLETWVNLAKTCKTLQMDQIKAAILKHLNPNMKIIGAGAGSFLVRQLAYTLDMPYEPISMNISGHIDSNLKYGLEACFPAYAVAILAGNYA